MRGGVLPLVHQVESELSSMPRRNADEVGAWSIEVAERLFKPLFRAGRHRANDPNMALAADVAHLAVQAWGRRRRLAVEDSEDHKLATVERRTWRDRMLDAEARRFKGPPVSEVLLSPAAPSR